MQVAQDTTYNDRVRYEMCHGVLIGTLFVNFHWRKTDNLRGYKKIGRRFA